MDHSEVYQKMLYKYWPSMFSGQLHQSHVEQEAVNQEEGAPQKSKKELAKEAKRKAMEDQKREKLEQQEKERQQDPCKNLYGDMVMCQSTEQTFQKYTKINQINESMIGQEVLIRARCANIRKISGSLYFLVLRQTFDTVQIVAFKSKEMSKFMFEFISQINKESVIDLYGKVTKAEQAIESCTCKQEIALLKIFVVSRASPQLPFSLEDASSKAVKGEYDEAEGEDKEEEVKQQEEGKEGVTTKVVRRVGLKNRLDNRVIDLRTPGKQAIFRLSSGVCQLFREFLITQNFTEIHTPKLIAGTSEGGANVFKLNYFGTEACLAQSPQFYKQMCIMADFDRVFEIGPVFRAEKARTHRHLTEFTGLDIEMTIVEHYYELMDFCEDLFYYIFENLISRFSKELAAINEQFEFQPFKVKKPVLRLTFEEACKMLNENGVKQSNLEDFTTDTEKQLGKIVKQKYDQDFYFVHRYPLSARPFYTMVCKDDPNYTNSYDFFMRGEEITSGSQRIHDPVLLEERAKVHNIPIHTIQSYIDAFKYGAPPHGGAGVGLERVIMLYCELANVRNTSMFPRDTKRITP